MSQFLGYFKLETGVYFIGICYLVDLIAQFVFMYFAGTFFWFGIFWPIFDIIKTFISFLSFYNMHLNNTLKSRYINFTVNLVNTIGTGICSIIIGLLTFQEALAKNETLTYILFYCFIFVTGFPFMIYCTYITYSYYNEKLNHQNIKIE